MSNKNSSQRNQFTGQEKVAILREHFIDKVPVSQVCEKHRLNPTVFYRWQQEFFEKGAKVFEHQSPRMGPTLEQRVKVLTDKLAKKDQVIAELMEEHLMLKKNLGEI